MELVYLWVEDYKNIHKQGFNFSSRFTCEYDEDSNQLTIDENDDYIENFFGDNINVTAIVGKNGSGKSSLIKLIFMLIYCKKYNNNGLSPYLHDNILETIRPFANKELFLVIHHNDQFKKISMKYFCKKLSDNHPEIKRKDKDIPFQECKLNIIYNDNSYTNELEEKDLDFFSVHFNYMLDTLYDGEQDKWIKEIYHKADSYETPLLLEPYKNNNDAQQINLDIIEYLNNQNMLRFYKSFSSDEKITKFFNPNKIYLDISKKNFDWLNLSDEDFDCLQDCLYFVAYKFYKLYEDNDTFLSLREESKEKICRICKKIKALYDNKEYENISYLYIVLKVLTSDRKLFNNYEYETISSWASSLEDEENLLAFTEKLNLSVLIDANAPDYEVRKIRVTINFIVKKIYTKEDFLENIGKIATIKEVSDILEFIPPWINVEWFEDNKSIKSLSSGEKSFFTFLVNLMYQIKNINDEPKYTAINLFLDETELGFHPEWQKEYLSNILRALSSINKKKINIIFATHAPFLISDLSKQNVMFLKDGKQDKGIIHKQTFGANIHTLLSDSFFMEDGLMGEFAKSKIEEVIDYLNDKKSPIKDNNKAQKLIDIIGEPIIRNQLQKMLDSKRLTKMDEIDIIKVEIADLEKRLEDIEDANNKA